MMKTLMQLKLEAVLNKTSPKQSIAKPLGDIAKIHVRRSGKHALLSYKGKVQLPQNSGVVWLKSIHAINKYEASGCKVVYFN